MRISDPSNAVSSPCSLSCSRGGPLANSSGHANSMYYCDKIVQQSTQPYMVPYFGPPAGVSCEVAGNGLSSQSHTAHCQVRMAQRQEDSLMARAGAGPSRLPLSPGDALPSSSAADAEPRQRRNPAPGDAGAARRCAAPCSSSPAACQRSAPCLVLARVRCRVAPAVSSGWSVPPVSFIGYLCVCLCVRLLFSAPPRISYRYMLFFVSWAGTLFWYYVFLFDPVVACRASAGASRAAS